MELDLEDLGVGHLTTGGQIEVLSTDVFCRIFFDICLPVKFAGQQRVVSKRRSKSSAKDFNPLTRVFT